MISCESKSSKTVSEQVKDSTGLSDRPAINNNTLEPTPEFCKNDSLDELACIISGIQTDKPRFYPDVVKKKSFQEFSHTFTRKWSEFDTSRLSLLQTFSRNEIRPNVSKCKTLFYPFSGPDFLYANAFFPDANVYILMGLEPVGSLPVFSADETADSTSNYFNALKKSLHAILNFSFFRTVAMKTDLHDQEVNGTVHLLLLFIKRSEFDICSVKPGFIDTSGQWNTLNNFDDLARKISNNKGVEIIFSDTSGIKKTLYYFSIHLEDGALKHNRNLKNYFGLMGNVTTYLKGASYLMHESYFSEIRNYILKKSSTIVQDDSGIAFRYFKTSEFNWEYSLYGNYVKPISLFSYAYQTDLDSLWKVKGSKSVGFGIGYNFKDKNSNLMIAKKIK